ncbi:MAG: SAM-dependent chlorinase/fluorinase [Planctomycetales bacterium]
MSPPIITLLTDFGTADTYVGQMKGVILGIFPEARIVDLTHETPPQDVEAAAYALDAAISAFPPGTVHVVVVDPGVGSERRLLMAEADGQRLVAPDNGVLEPVLQRASSVRVHELRERWFQREPRSDTFHGRDVIAPAAAHWAKGTSLEKFGPPLQGARVPLPLGDPTVEADGIQGAVRSIDHFGNAITNIPVTLIPEDRRSSAIIRIGTQSFTGLRSCYSDVEPEECLVLVSSSGHLEIAQRNGNAAAVQGISRGMKVAVSWNVADS